MPHWHRRVPGLATSRFPHRSRTTGDTWETVMAGTNKGGREAKKPKADNSKKVKGQTPSAAPAVDAISQKSRRAGQ